MRRFDQPLLLSACIALTKSILRKFDMAQIGS